MTRWLFSALLRVPSLVIGFVLGHVAILVWKFYGKNYLVWAKWTAENILIPMHVWVVKFFEGVWPQFAVYVANHEPTAADAPHLYSAILTVTIAFAVRLIVRIASWVGWAMNNVLWRGWPEPRRSDEVQFPTR